MILLDRIFLTCLVAIKVMLLIRNSPSEIRKEYPFSPASTLLKVHVYGSGLKFLAQLKYLLFKGTRSVLRQLHTFLGVHSPVQLIFKTCE